LIGFRRNCAQRRTHSLLACTALTARQARKVHERFTHYTWSMLLSPDRRRVPLRLLTGLFAGLLCCTARGKRLQERRYPLSARAPYRSCRTRRQGPASPAPTATPPSHSVKHARDECAFGPPAAAASPTRAINTTSRGITKILGFCDSHHIAVRHRHRSHCRVHEHETYVKRPRLRRSLAGQDGMSLLRAACCDLHVHIAGRINPEHS
jgi:hypothetical protein